MTRLALVVLLSSVALSYTDPERDTNSTAHMHDVEARIEARVNESEGRVDFHAVAERTHMDGPRFSPYISYWPEFDEHCLYGTVRTSMPDRLLLHGARIRVGSERFSIGFGPKGYKYIDDYRTVEVASTPAGAKYVEELHIPIPTDRTSGSSRYWILYCSPDKDAFYAIAAAPESIEVKVRATGTEGYVGWSMTSREKQACRDVVYYYRHFRERTKDYRKLIR